MAFLRNRNAPASAPGGLSWASPHEIIEVADDLAHDLLAIVSAGFHEVLPGDPEHPTMPELPRHAAPEDDEPAEPEEPAAAEPVEKTPITEPAPPATATGPKPRPPAKAPVTE